jgi:hypothetical protein
MRYILIVLALTILNGCNSVKQTSSKTEAPKTAQEWIDYSISYHDPKNNWQKFKSQIRSFSKVDRGGESLEESTRKFSFENQTSSFAMRMEVQDYPLSIDITNDNCQTIWKKKEQTIEEQNKYITDCKYGENYRNYYRYLIGIPMVLKDESTIVNQLVEDEKINDKIYKKVTVNYAPVKANPTWEFFIDPLNGKLVRSKFIRYNDKNQVTGGEILDYPEHQLFQGMQLRTKMLWYYLNEKFLADETYVYGS